jgi:hypothetical protein
VDEGLQALKSEHPELRSEELVPVEFAPEQAPKALDQVALDQAASDEVALDQAVSAETASPTALVPLNWLRMALTIEFLLALMTVYTLWSEIGGQGHLDLLPWYTKLVCGAGLSWAVVRFTAGIVECGPVWNGRSRRWFVIILLFIAAMGGIVYYYHLHETPDEPDSEDAAATSLHLSRGGKLSQRI